MLVLGQNLGPGNEIIFWSILVFGRSIPNAFCDLVFYLLKVGEKMSSKKDGVSWFQNLKTVVAVRHSTQSSRGSKFILLKCRTFVLGNLKPFWNALLINGCHDVQP